VRGEEESEISEVRESNSKLTLYSRDVVGKSSTKINQDVVRLDLGNGAGGAIKRNRDITLNKSLVSGVVTTVRASTIRCTRIQHNLTLRKNLETIAVLNVSQTRRRIEIGVLPHLSSGSGGAIALSILNDPHVTRIIGSGQTFAQNVPQAPLDGLDNYLIPYTGNLGIALRDFVNKSPIKIGNRNVEPKDTWGILLIEVKPVSPA